MEQLDLLRYLTRVIEAMGLRYFVTGSTATIFYGEPRFTNDIDVVVELPPERIGEFCHRFPPASPNFTSARRQLRQASLNKTQFNIIHPESGLKVDVIVPESSPFNKSRFIRVRRVRCDRGLDACFAAPEDVILKKMDYYRQGGSEKHLRDIVGVLKTTRSRLT